MGYKNNASVQTTGLLELASCHVGLCQVTSIRHNIMNL